MKANGITIQLDKLRLVRFSISTLIRIQKDLGLNRFQLLQAEDGIPEFVKDVELVIKLLTFSLQAEDNELTFEKVVELVDDYSSIADVVEKVAEALALANTNETFQDTSKKKSK